KFKTKCEQRLEQMRNEGATVLFVSHSIEQVKSICDKAIWLNQGNIMLFGNSKEVCDAYSLSLKDASVFMGES
ncbi:MAG: hypothetical protein RR444_11420, partial [Oscillospiraceae bacterium]